MTGKSHAAVLLNTDMIILLLGKVSSFAPRKVIELSGSCVSEYCNPYISGCGGVVFQSKRSSMYLRV